MTTKELLALVADWRRAAHQLRGDCEPMPASAMRLDECADELEAALASDTGGRGVDAKWLAVLDNHIAQLCVESPEDEAHRASMVQARDYFAALRTQPTSPPESGGHGWVPVSERMPPDDVMVLVYWTEEGEDRYDFEATEEGVWIKHAEHYDNYLSVALPENSRGPSEQAPYTHWRTVEAPAAPAQPDGVDATYQPNISSGDVDNGGDSKVGEAVAWQTRWRAWGGGWSNWITLPTWDGWRNPNNEYRPLYASQPAEAVCTCPSGDGSLRWPCPQHPPVQQKATAAGGPSFLPDPFNEPSEDDFFDWPEYQRELAWCSGWNACLAAAIKLASATPPAQAAESRAEAARDFPANTCPASRAVQLIAERIKAGTFRPEPYMADSLFTVVAALWELRKPPAQAADAVERVARAIAVGNNCVDGFDIENGLWRMLEPEQQVKYRALARAAIAAMREGEA